VRRYYSMLLFWIRGY